VNDERTDASSGGQEPEEPLGLAVLTEEVLPALIARLRSSRLGELEVGGDGWRVRLRRAPEPLRTEMRGRASGEAGIEPAAVAADQVARSPGVGYFQPSSELVMGASVQAGDILGSVDVLGIVQDIVAPSAGMISRVLAEDGQAVEYGQALADIDPLDTASVEPEGAAD
jgi:acetyl-CoA carboxylase biotin carboxyl carrier protein